MASALDLYAGVLQWVPIVSTNVRRAAYQPEFHRLFIEFKSGQTYYYESVDPGVAGGFFAAPSKGQYVYYVLRNKGKDDRFPCFGPF